MWLFFFFILCTLDDPPLQIQSQHTTQVNRDVTENANTHTETSKKQVSCPSNKKVLCVRVCARLLGLRDCCIDEKKNKKKKKKCLLNK